VTPASVRLLFAERELVAISESLHELTHRRDTLLQEARETRCSFTAADDTEYRALKESAGKVATRA
jgi:hypothetical protein